MTHSFDQLDLHGERAALRGNPSFVWRAGQDRRLRMIRQWGGPLGDTLGQVLVDGCGVGMYVKALAPHADTVYGIDIEGDHLEIAVETSPDARLQLAMGEALPYADDVFDLVLSHEVLEHVLDDRTAAAEIVRVLKRGGRAIIFAPNRLYPFETHGHYWRGDYYFGNTPLINYLPTSLRNRLAPHVRAYSRQDLLDLFLGQPVRVLHLTQMYPGYDNIVYRRPRLGSWLKRITYSLEQTPLAVFGISHLLVVEKTG
jgi:SAM-dependent methyltransferase